MDLHLFYTTNLITILSFGIGPTLQGGLYTSSGGACGSCNWRESMRATSWVRSREQVSSKSLWSAGSSHIKCIIFNFIFHPISRFGYFSWDPFRCSLKWCLYIRIGCWIENPFLLWYNASEEITTNNKQLSSFKKCIPDVDDTHFLGNVSCCLEGLI